MPESSDAPAIAGIANVPNFASLVETGKNVRLFGTHVSDMDDFERLASIGHLHDRLTLAERGLIEQREAMMRLSDRSAPDGCARCWYARATTEAKSLSCRRSPPKLGTEKWPLVRPHHWCGHFKSCVAPQAVAPPPQPLEHA